jgi:DNA-binding NarL/FixJ family response regulator
MTRPPKIVADYLESCPPLPLKDGHWQEIVRALRLSPQQARIAEFVLRGMCDKQIAAAMGIREPTLRTYLSRIFARTRTGGRMELAMRVLEVSHKVPPGRHQK